MAFIENKYYLWYFNLIEKVKKQSRHKGDGVYYERHHIYPKSIFPDQKNDHDNLVLLTAKEHYIAHLMLIKMFPIGSIQRKKMLFAYHKMRANPHNLRYVPSKTYESIRTELARCISENAQVRLADPTRNGMYGRIHDEETRKKMRRNSVGKNKGSIKSPETKAKMAEARRRFWERKRANG